LTGSFPSQIVLQIYGTSKTWQGLCGSFKSLGKAYAAGLDIQLVAKVSAKNWVLMQKAMHCYRMCRFSSQPLQVQLPSIVVDAVKG
jgi:hypothetical protein